MSGDAISKSVVGTGADGDKRQCLEAWTGQHVFQSSQHLVQSGKLGRVRAWVGREGPKGVCGIGWHGVELMGPPSLPQKMGPLQPHGVFRALGSRRKRQELKSQSQGGHQGAQGPGMTLHRRSPDDNTIRHSKFRRAGALKLSEGPEPDGFPPV
ncbi:hypothetical protein F5144DRAFT_549334 [Chaetomium tenue]|uniref:Uncharacterized protein n=1 Tax=Chaetomium tenue TaxID=1854479 RepID=A0ACB7P5T2_9PEZI|nr:hypothetical protein F5144DRAFT_549334 [Chaetomium globosum]